MKIEFDGAVSIEVPTDDELSEIYDTVKGTMQQEEALDLMREIKERTDRMAAADAFDAIAEQVKEGSKNE